MLEPEAEFGSKRHINTLACEGLHLVASLYLNKRHINSLIVIPYVLAVEIIL